MPKQTAVILSVVAVLILAGWLISRYALPNPAGNLTAVNLENLSTQPGGEVPSGSLGNEPVNAVSQEASLHGLTQADVDGIRAALAERFGLTLPQIEITIGEDSTAEFATGRVNVGEGDQGGVYFAAKTENGWEIAYDGRGVVECEPLARYSIPAGFAPRCYDPVTGQNVDR